MIIMQKILKMSRHFHPFLNVTCVPGAIDILDKNSSTSSFFNKIATKKEIF